MTGAVDLGVAATRHGVRAALNAAPADYRIKTLADVIETTCREAQAAHGAQPADCLGALALAIARITDRTVKHRENADAARQLQRNTCMVAATHLELLLALPRESAPPATGEQGP